MALIDRQDTLHAELPAANIAHHAPAKALNELYPAKVDKFRAGFSQLQSKFIIQDKSDS